MNANDDAIRRSALERFNLHPEATDYNLQRVVRIACLSLGGKQAAFSVRFDDRQHYVAVYGGDWGTVSGENSICHSVAMRGEPLWSADLSMDEEWRDHPTVTKAGGARAYVGTPVYASTKVPIGTLCVRSDQPIDLDSDENRLIVNDCVRLIEDSLLMRRDAVRDQLTGLFNRRYFERQIDAEWRRAMRMQLPITMMMLDIDHFKTLNDTAGHLAGDKAIQAVAEVLNKTVTRAGDVACRFGGEEFAIILPTTSPSKALLVGERIRAALYEAAIPHPGRPGHMDRLTISIGIATVTSHTDLLKRSAVDVLAEADSALYQAKLAGRNCLYQADLTDDAEHHDEN